MAVIDLSAELKGESSTKAGAGLCMSVQAVLVGRSGSLGVRRPQPAQQPNEKPFKGE